ncbi:MAG: Ribosomal RNA large subunit methyltransferase K/L [Eubacteriales bacterium SKADARSKE-1]|nr:Ribosomal RNA large subunit methyltransferase K/L [Eubacteriales bacterium SKADARSKE-1]
MRLANWNDYELIDASSGEKLERWGDIILIRPDPQIIWNTPKQHPLWKDAHAKYHRSSSGGGHWETLKDMPETWEIKYQKLTFRLKMMGFKHTGIFPEQATNWDFIADKISKSSKKLKILNLFAYTGGATLAAAKAGAEVCHVDASRGMVTWARENAKSSSLENAPIRWLIDDCIKFVEKEKRRGNLYDGIIMDPPSYGRGPGGEVWKLESKLFSLLNTCSEILSTDAKVFILNSYTTGLSPSVMEYLLGVTVAKGHGGLVSSSEIGLPVTTSGLVLPCGATAIWQS